MSFVNIGGLLGALSLGALAAAAPLIIHILNRRRFRVIEWAAMRFLLEAERINRRRVLLEQLLLLAARMLLAALVVWMVLRPIATGGASALLTGRRHHVVILDDSRSMTSISGGMSMLDRARDLLIELAERQGERAPQDLLSVVRTSNPGEPDLSQVALGAPDALERVRAFAASTYFATDGSARLAEALGTAAQLAADTPGATSRFLLVCDGCIADLRAEGGSEADPALVEAARAADALGDLALVIVESRGERENLGILGLEIEEGAVVAGAPVSILVSVANLGNREARDIAITVGTESATRSLPPIPTLAPGERTITRAPFAFSQVGSHLVTARMDGDRYHADDEAYLAVDVLEALDVLIVDGEPPRGARDGDTARGSESYFLSRALAPTGLIRSGLRVEVVGEERFAGIDLSTQAAVILANAFRIEADQIEALEKYVAGGGGLILFLGDQVDRAAYDRDLYRESEGLLPAKLGRERGDATGDLFASFGAATTGHPVTAIFDGEENPFVAPVKLYAWIELEPGADATTLLVTTPGRGGATTGVGAPILVERAFGRGRVLCFGIPADDEWSNWPGEPSFLVTMQEAVRHVAPRTSGQRNLDLGSHLVWPIDPAVMEVRGRLLPPPPAPPRDLVASRVEELPLAFDLGGLTRAGAWRLDTHERSGTVHSEHVVVWGSRRESDQRLLDEEGLDRLLGEIEIELITEPDRLLDDAGETDRAELWRSLAVAALALMLLESFMAAAFSGTLWRRR